MDKTKTSDLIRVLIIDDNTEIHEDFRKSLDPVISEQVEKLSDLDKTLFEKAPIEEVEAPTYELSFATQGQEGLECVKKSLLESKPFALAFVDIRMPPGWDGVATIQEIWKVDPWIQIVICTAYSDYSWNEMIRKTGGTDNLIIIKKPFDIVEIQQATYALTEKWKLSQEVKKHINNLESAVKNRTEELEKSLTLIRTTLESTADGILVVDVDGKVINYNAKFLQMWNIPESAVKNKQNMDFLALMQNQLEEPELYLSKIQQLSVNEQQETLDELQFLDKKFFERYSKPYILNGQIMGRVWNYRDITWRKNLQQELLYQATHDALTNLPNRRLMDDLIRQQIAVSKRKNEKFAILYLDLDNFKSINDNLGHTAGDFVLTLVTKRIISTIREMDILARLGGDEFGIVAPGIKDQKDVKIIATKILKNIETPFFIDKNEYVITTSIGIVLYPNNGNSPEDLLKNADAAMYCAKKENKNNFQFYQTSMTIQTKRNFKIEHDLRRAIVSHEFELYYQPIVDIFNKKIVGVEALIRWFDPKLGVSMPSEFIKIAEEHGLIVTIGEWVIRTACQQNKHWQNLNIPPIKMAVNVSSIQFKTPNFDYFLKNVLNETDLDPKYLDLELTESVILETPELILSVLNKIRALGIHLIIDDFGTGYSSLSYLKRYPFYKLKIDQSFIKDIEKNKNDYKLVQAIVAIGEHLKLEVIAEGVETKQQLLQLKSAKCKEIQGYYISKPMDSVATTNFLRTYDFDQLSKT